MKLALANILWFLSCLPGCVAFLFAAVQPGRAQRSVLRRILRRNRTTWFGACHGFAGLKNREDFAHRVPLSEYEDYKEAITRVQRGEPSILTAGPVRVLQPTSGSSSEPKLVPYTEELHREFRAALEPWIASLYLRYPALFFGRHYWSISPNTRVARQQEAPGEVRIGFADDSEYLGGLGRRLARTLLVVPAEISHVKDPETFEFLTLLFLVREPRLRLISVWHPSFLTGLLDGLPRRYPQLVETIRLGRLPPHLQLAHGLLQHFERGLAPDPRRASCLEHLDVSNPGGPARIWPHLALISCWAGDTAQAYVARLRETFPGATIQAKGLLATEGCVTIPMGKPGRHVACARSHFYEFMQRESGRVCRLAELEDGEEYSVVLTTGGGLYRYRLHDLVRVTGRYGRTPCLAFLSRDGVVSDLVGEKLHLRHVEETLRAVETRCGVPFEFAMLAPDGEGRGDGYVLYAKCAADRRVDRGELAEAVEAGLSENFHYRHARRLGQLARVRVRLLRGDPARTYRQACVARGMREGDVKLTRLHRDKGWDRVFEQP